jgi:protein-S-isoprenylcysteine O-methyltransferase Ste14
VTRSLFRVARPATARTNVLKTLAQVVVVWTFALVLLPVLVVAAERRLDVPTWDGPVTRAAGAALFLVGSGCGLWSAWLMAVRGKGTPVPFDAARELVIEGPYRIVRNPMAVSAVNQTIGIAVFLGSSGVLGLAVGGGLVWHALIRPSEERFLASTFGAPYEDYRASVRCWIPTWPPYRPHR